MCRRRILSEVFEARGWLLTGRPTRLAVASESLCVHRTPVLGDDDTRPVADSPDLPVELVIARNGKEFYRGERPPDQRALHKGVRENMVLVSVPLDRISRRFVTEITANADVATR